MSYRLGNSPEMETLRTWRKSKGKTCDEVGSLVGVSGVAISRYENGRVPEPVTMKKIIRVTGGSVQPNDWFSSELNDNSTFAEAV